MPTINAAAAAAVWRHSLDPADKWRLLRMIGLVDELGNLAPDDTRTIDVPVNETQTKTRIGQQTEHLMTVRPLQSTAPEALRNLPPVAVPPKPAATPKTKRPKAVIKPAKATGKRGRPTKTEGEYVHGTQWGYRRHTNNGETPCDACRTAKRDADRKYEASRTRNTIGAPRTATCGTPGGARRHRSLAEPTCEPCRQAENAAQRARWNAKKGDAA